MGLGENSDSLYTHNICIRMYKQKLELHIQVAIINTTYVNTAMCNTG